MQVYNIVCTRKPRTPQGVMHKIENASVPIPSATLLEVCHSVAHNYQQCTAAVGGHFEHL
jgi:hypothetical protein